MEGFGPEKRQKQRRNQRPTGGTESAGLPSPTLVDRQVVQRAAANIQNAGPADVRLLQRVVGNRAVTSLIRRTLAPAPTPSSPPVRPVIQRRMIDYLGERLNTAQKTREELTGLMSTAVEKNKRDVARQISEAIDAGDYKGAKAEAKQRATMRKRVAKASPEKMAFTSFRSKEQNRALLGSFTPGTEFQPKEDRKDFDPNKNYIPSFPGVYEVDSKSFVAKPSGFTRSTKEFQRKDKGYQLDKRGTPETIEPVRKRNLPRNGGHWVMNSAMGSFVPIKKMVPFTVFLRQRALVKKSDESSLGNETYLEVQFVSGYDSKHDENIIKYSRDIVTAIHKSTGYPVTVSFETMHYKSFEDEAEQRKKEKPKKGKMGARPRSNAETMAPPKKENKGGFGSRLRNFFSRLF